MLRTTAALVLLSSFSSVALAQCPSTGVALTASGGRLGDGWRVDAVGPAGALGVFGLDIAGGTPVPTPFGPICLGLTPALVALTFVFDPTGHGFVGGVMPANPIFAGTTIYAAALAFSPQLPGGFGVGNGAQFTLREPRFWCVSPGTTSPFGSTPGVIVPMNGISDSTLYSLTLPSSVIDAATAPQRGLLVVRLGNGALAAYDGSGPTPVWNVALTGNAASSSRLLAVSDDLLLMLSPGSAPGPFGGGTPGTIHLVSLTNGALLQSYPMASGNPDAMLAVAGTTQVVLRLASGVATFDWSNGQYSPVTALPTTNGGFVDWQATGGLLYVLHSGTTPGPFGGTGTPPAVSVVTIPSPTVLWTVPLTMTGTASMLRVGPGSAGPGLYVYGSAGVLQEYSQVLVNPVGSLSVGTGINSMELSALGTQWLLLCAGGGCGGPTLLQMAAGTNTLLPVAALQAAPSPLAVSPSASYGKACFVQGSNLGTPFVTDPAGTLGGVVLPAPTSAGWRILVD